MARYPLTYFSFRSIEQIPGADGMTEIFFRQSAQKLFVEDDDGVFATTPGNPEPGHATTLAEAIELDDDLIDIGSDLQIYSRSPFSDSAGVFHDMYLIRMSDGHFIAVIPGFTPDPDETYLAKSSDRVMFYEEDLTIPLGRPALCFTRGTRIEAERGEIAIELLQPGERVWTLDHGLQVIRWIGWVEVDQAQLIARPDLRPVRIRAGALGDDRPARDLLVSPQHRVLVRSKIALKMFDVEEVLVAAKQLLPLPGIEIAEDLTFVDYFHILFDQHEILLSNGAETESLYTGPEALRSVGAAARDEIFAIFPELRHPHYLPQAARPLVIGRQARRLAERHAQNDRDLTG